MKFGWDEGKNRRNIVKHGIDFQDAKGLFHSQLGYLDKEDDREDYGEERRVRLGWMQDLPICLVYTIRAEVIWIISARLAEKSEEIVLIRQVSGEKQFQQGVRNIRFSKKQQKKRSKDIIRSKKERDER